MGEQARVPFEMANHIRGNNPKCDMRGWYLATQQKVQVEYKIDPDEEPEAGEKIAEKVVYGERYFVHMRFIVNDWALKCERRCAEG